MPPASPPLESADSLYPGFPDFASWGPLQAEDADLWSRFAASLQERRKAASPEALKASVDVAIRAAALDTGAIEGLYTADRGFTMTVAVQGLAWEQMIEERGAGVRDLFEAQLAAYELVLDAVTHKLPVTEAWIRALHETLCGPQTTYRVLTASGWQDHELPKGRYKTQPNHVHLKDGTVHAYAPVDQVSSEMHRLVEQLGSPEFEAAHPILQASWVHYAFVMIHPFADGNGRVARALASVYFYRCCSIPLLVFANQRLAYLDALHAADQGELRPLLGFFRDRGIDTMQLVSESMTKAGLPDVEDLSRKINLKATGQRLLLATQETLQRRFDALNIDPDFSLIWTSKGALAEFVLLWRISEMHEVTTLGIAVRIEPKGPFAFRILTERNDDFLDVRAEDVMPELSSALRFRLDAWSERQLARMLVEIANLDT